MDRYQRWPKDKLIKGTTLWDFLIVLHSYEFVLQYNKYEYTTLSLYQKGQIPVFVDFFLNNAQKAKNFAQLRPEAEKKFMSPCNPHLVPIVGALPFPVLGLF